MKAQICKCCGKPFTDPARGAKTSHICAYCESLFEDNDSVAGPRPGPRSSGKSNFANADRRAQSPQFTKR